MGSWNWVLLGSAFVFHDAAIYVVILGSLTGLVLSFVLFESDWHVF